MGVQVSELREELEARCLSPKGLKTQLAARLAKVIKTEAEEEQTKKGCDSGNEGSKEKDNADDDGDDESKENTEAGTSAEVSSPQDTTTTKRNNDDNSQSSSADKKKKEVNLGIWFGVSFIFHRQGPSSLTYFKLVLHKFLVDFSLCFG